MSAVLRSGQSRAVGARCARGVLATGLALGVLTAVGASPAAARVAEERHDRRAQPAAAQAHRPNAARPHRPAKTKATRPDHRRGAGPAEPRAGRRAEGEERRAWGRGPAAPPKQSRRSPEPGRAALRTGSDAEVDAPTLAAPAPPGRAWRTAPDRLDRLDRPADGKSQQGKDKDDKGAAARRPGPAGPPTAPTAPAAPALEPTGPLVAAPAAPLGRTGVATPAAGLAPAAGTARPLSDVVSVPLAPSRRTAVVPAPEPASPGVGPLARVPGVVGDVGTQAARNPEIPVAILLALVVFLVLQHRLDRADPKLQRSEPADARPLRFGPPLRVPAQAD